MTYMWHCLLTASVCERNVISQLRGNPVQQIYELKLCFACRGILAHTHCTIKTSQVYYLQAICPR